MPTDTFEAFKAELAALRNAVSLYPKKTLRDDALRDRFQMLFRTWTSTVRPKVEPLLQGKRDFLKIEAELEKLSLLASKYKPIIEYQKRLNRAIQLTGTLVLYLPPTGQQKLLTSYSSDLFLPSIPDLPSKFVPNALFGWRRKIEDFTAKYPFDKSVFIMVRYRDKNSRLINKIKSKLSMNGYIGILASDHKLTDDLYNPIACLLCCARGIAVFDEAEVGQKFNPNVAYELGMMHLLNRECLILKHQSLKTLNTDILMKLYEEYQTVDEACTHIEMTFPPFIGADSV